MKKYFTLLKRSSTNYLSKNKTNNLEDTQATFSEEVPIEMSSEIFTYLAQTDPDAFVMLLSVMHCYSTELDKEKIPEDKLASILSELKLPKKETQITRIVARAEHKGLWLNYLSRTLSETLSPVEKYEFDTENQTDTSDIVAHIKENPQELAAVIKGGHVELLKVLKAENAIPDLSSEPEAKLVAAKRGFLKVLEALGPENVFPENSKGTRAPFRGLPLSNEFFTEASKSGQLHVLRWIDQERKTEITPETLFRSLALATNAMFSEAQNLEFDDSGTPKIPLENRFRNPVIWLKNKCFDWLNSEEALALKNSTPMDYWKIQFQALFTASKLNDGNAIRYLCQHLNFKDAPRQLPFQVMFNACKPGNLAVLEVMQEIFQFSREDGYRTLCEMPAFRQQNDESRGVNMNVDDWSKTEINILLLLLESALHLKPEIFQWFQETFPLSIADQDDALSMLMGLHYVITSDCADRFDIAENYMNVFVGLNKQTVGKHLSPTLERICELGNIEGLKWVIKTFDVSKEDDMETIQGLVEVAAHVGSYKMMISVFDCLELTPADFPDSFIKKLRASIHLPNRWATVPDRRSKFTYLNDGVFVMNADKLLFEDLLARYVTFEDGIISEESLKQVQEKLSSFEENSIQKQLLHRFGGYPFTIIFSTSLEDIFKTSTVSLEVKKTFFETIFNPLQEETRQELWRILEKKEASFKAEKDRQARKMTEQYNSKRQNIEGPPPNAPGMIRGLPKSSSSPTEPDEDIGPPPLIDWGEFEGACLASLQESPKPATYATLKSSLLSQYCENNLFRFYSEIQEMVFTLKNENGDVIDAGNALHFLATSPNYRLTWLLKFAQLFGLDIDAPSNKGRLAETLLQGGASASAKPSHKNEIRIYDERLTLLPEDSRKALEACKSFEAAKAYALDTFRFPAKMLILGPEKTNLSLLEYLIDRFPNEVAFTSDEITRFTNDEPKEGPALIKDKAGHIREVCLGYKEFYLAVVPKERQDDTIIQLFPD